MKLKWFTFCKDKREKTQSDDIPHFDKYKDFHFDSLMGSFDMSGYKKQNDDWLCTLVIETSPKYSVPTPVHRYIP